MMKKVINIAIIALTIESSILHAQEKKIENNYQNDSFYFADKELSESQLTTNDFLYDLMENQVNINNCDLDDLRRIPLISENQADAILNYIQVHGMFISKYELQAVPGFSIQFIKSILPFIRIDDKIYTNKPGFYRRWKTSPNHYFLIRGSKTLEKKRGHLLSGNESAYLGSPIGYIVKYRSSLSRDFSIGFVVGKDSGEQWRWNPKKQRFGFDQIGFHINLWPGKKIQQIIIGDYKLQFGQGLTFSAGFNPGKSIGNTVVIRRQTIGIVPYNSVAESGFMRGMAATFAIRNWKITPFISYLKKDAHLIFDSLENRIKTKSIIIDGLHRNRTALNRYKQLPELLAGIGIVYHSNNGNTKMGITWHLQQYKYPLVKSSLLYKHYDWLGDLTYYQSVFFSHQWNNINSFGQMGLNKNGQKGMLIGMIASLAKSFDLTVVYRNYHPGFLPIQGNSLSENTKSSNESGFYWGYSFKPDRRFQLGGYADFFKFQWLKYQVDRPSSGRELATYMKYQFSRKNEATLSYKSTTKSKHLNNQSNVNQISSFVSRAIKFNLKYEVNGNIQTHTHIQWSNTLFSEEMAMGFSIGQDIHLKFKRLQLNQRFLFFDTDNYDNRHYRYENDVRYAYNIPAFSGLGIRYYGVVKIKMAQHLILEGKFSKTKYFNKDEIGTGNESIRSSSKTDVVIQCKYNFN